MKQWIAGIIWMAGAWFCWIPNCTAQQFNEGTILFETTFFQDWENYDNLHLKPALDEIERSEMSVEEKEQEKKERIEFNEKWKAKAKEMLGEMEQESVEYAFNKDMAVAKRMQKGVPRDEFLTIEFDSRQMTNRFFLKGKLQEYVVSSTLESASTNWSDIRDSVRIDSTDTKEILGFQCVKYYVEHTHLLSGQKDTTRFRYELYVTDAFHLPFFIFEAAATKELFRGCALEIKYMTQKDTSSYSIMRATAFSQVADPSRFDIPEKFRN